MPRSLLGATLRDRRRGLIGWVVGVLALTVFVMGVHEVLWQSEAVQNLLARFPSTFLAMLGVDPDMLNSGAGFIQAQLYAFVGPLLVLIYAIGFGASATTAEEDNRTADLLLALPLRRERVVVEKFVAMLLSLLAIVLSFAVVLIVGNALAELALPLQGILAANAGLLLLALLHGTLALAVGAGTGSRGAAAAAAAALAITSFLLQGLTRPEMALRKLVVVLPFDWYLRELPLLNGFSSGHALLGAASLVALIAATLAFRRRDLLTAAPLLGGERARGNGASRRDIAPRSGFLLGGIYGKSLWLRRRSIFGWMLGLCGIAALTMMFWPTLSQGAAELEQLIEMLPAEVFAAFGMSDPKDLITAGGFVSSRVYASVGLVLMLAFAIGMGAASVAGEERRGTMEMQLATPLPRGRLVLGAFAAMGTLIAVLAIALFVVMIISNAALDLDIAADSIASATLGLALTGLFFGALALSIGAATGNEGLARGIPAAVAVAGFLINGLGAAVDSLAPFRYLSPLYWFLGNTPPLLRSFSPAPLVLLAAGVVLVGIGMLGFERRDMVH